VPDRVDPVDRDAAAARGSIGTHLAAVAQGPVVPLSRDELIECAALVRAAQERQLDRLIIPSHPLDILAQQIVATWHRGVAGGCLFEMVRGAYPYRDVARKDFDAVVQMLAEGFTTRAGAAGRVRPLRRRESPGYARAAAPARRAHVGRGDS